MTDKGARAIGHSLVAVAAIVALTAMVVSGHGREAVTLAVTLGGIVMFLLLVVA